MSDPPPATRGTALSDFEFIAQWTDWLYAQGRAEKTVDTYAAAVSKLYRKFVRGSIESLTEAHMNAFLGSFGKRAPARTSAVRGVRSFCRYAARRGRLPNGDPTEDMRISKPKPRPMVVLEEDELGRYFLAAAWREPRRGWSLTLEFALGLRRSELAGIAPDDILDREVILRNCKGGKERRVPLNELARIAIEELRPTSNGTLCGGAAPSTITEWARQAAEDCGLWPKVRGRPSHVLRAAYITHLLRRGVPVQNVRDLVGHENIATTNGYAVSASGELERGAGALDDVFARRAGSQPIRRPA